MISRISTAVSRILFHFFAIFFSFSLIFSVFAHASNPGLCDWPVPSYKIHELSGTGLKFEEYTEVLDLVEKAYAPIFRAQGTTFKIKRSWSDGTPNAQAWCEDSDQLYCSGGTAWIEMFGGLARHPFMTKEAFAIVAVHEIGHHLGGFPFYTGEVMSCEGQADYYATRKGMRTLGLPSKDGSMVLARVLADLSGELRPWRPGPYLRPVSETYEEHPASQCRLRTLRSRPAEKDAPAVLV